MNTIRRGAALLSLVVVLCAAREASAGTPTDQLRADMDSLYAAVARGGGDTANILDRMFDWQNMARAALGEHWAGRTDAERAEFMRLFAAAFQRAYVSRAHLIDASRIQYLGDVARDDGRSTVKTHVVTKRGTAIAVDYTVRLRDTRWRVEDILVERVSLVDNYKSQFAAVLARSSYVALVDKLRTIAK